MTREQACQSLLSQLEATWPHDWQKTSKSQTSHPLEGETQSLLAGKASHLPFFRTTGDVAWITLAPDASSLRAAITGLHAWIIPSFGWEDRTRPLIRPQDYTGPLATALSMLSPAGYYRWHSSHTTATRAIFSKLRLWRQLLSQRPNFMEVRSRGLFELREQFRLALATGDHDLALQAITAIDERQLDTAANTLFMRMQLRSRFGLHREIVEEPRLLELMSLRLPHSVRIAIIEAFYEVYLRNPDEEDDEAKGLCVFKDKVCPAIAPLIALCHGDDGQIVDRVLNYYRASTEAPDSTHELRSDVLEAFQRADWRRVQEIGIMLLKRSQPESLEPVILRALLESLSYETNPELATALDSSRLSPGPPPQSWQEFVIKLRMNDLESARLFLELKERPTLDTSDAQLVREFVLLIEDMFTSPKIAMIDGVLDLLDRSLPLLIEDLVSEPEFPRTQLGDSYLAALQLWTRQRSGQLQPADVNAAISLATGVLCDLAHEEVRVAQLLREWWQTRPVRVRLPFLLEALDLLSDYCKDFAIPQGLWIDGVTFVKNQAVDLTRSEQALWVSVGQKLGFDQETIREYIPQGQSSEEQDEEDPLKSADLRRVAIVSLHQKAAYTAAELIRGRTGAEVIVVSESAAGQSTNKARTADVILLVWAATKHAVYRAFDDIRDKIAYVQGTGPSSVILALERWILGSRS